MVVVVVDRLVQEELISKVNIPTLILQCAEDVIAPEVIGLYMHQKMKNSKLVNMQATGHCPNLSAPEETIAAIKESNPPENNETVSMFFGLG